MIEHYRRPAWVAWVAASVVAVVVGLVAYNLGLDQAASGAAQGRHWHVGFPFGVFFLFWIAALLLRGLFWGGCWGPRWRGRYYDQWYDDPVRWDEWHRRAHEQMNRPAGPSSPA